MNFVFYDLKIRPRSGFFDALIPQYESSIDGFDLSTRRMRFHISSYVFFLFPCYAHGYTPRISLIAGDTQSYTPLYLGRCLARSAAPSCLTPHVAHKALMGICQCGSRHIVRVELTPRNPSSQSFKSILRTSEEPRMPKFQGRQDVKYVRQDITDHRVAP